MLLTQCRASTRQQAEYHAGCHGTPIGHSKHNTKLCPAEYLAVLEEQTWREAWPKLTSHSSLWSSCSSLTKWKVFLLKSTLLKRPLATVPCITANAHCDSICQYLPSETTISGGCPARTCCIRSSVEMRRPSGPGSMTSSPASPPERDTGKPIRAVKLAQGNL